MSLVLDAGALIAVERVIARLPLSSRWRGEAIGM